MVIVTGIPRSGTSIVGKVLGSLCDVEYAFEPPLVPYLDAQVRWGRMDPGDGVNILKTYLYFEYFVEYLHGRRYNFRPSDDSFVLSMKPFNEIVEKWKTIGSTQDAIDEAEERSLICKSPGVYTLLNHIYENSPKIMIIHIWRDLERIIASLMSKRWFHDENLGPDSTGLWPFLKTEGARMVPYPVAEDAIEAWQSMNAETRTVHVCNQLADDRRAFRQRYSGRETYYELDFGAFVQSPGEATAQLASFLGLTPGPKTEDIVNEVAPTDPPCDPRRILDRCDPVEAERFYRLHNTTGN